MTRSTLFDRLNQELGAFSRKAQRALDEGKLQLELVRVRRQRDQVARELGLVVHQRERGGQVATHRVDVLLFRLDDLTAEIRRLEEQVAARRQAAAEPRTAEGGEATTARGTPGVGQTGPVE